MPYVRAYTPQHHHIQDLGAQIGWQTVFFIEYFGPIFVHALLFYLPELFYGMRAKCICCVCVCVCVCVCEYVWTNACGCVNACVCV
jgi:hypothetical protein